MVHDIGANLLYSPHTKQGRSCTLSNYFAIAPASNDRYFIVKAPWSPINSNPTPIKHYMSDTTLSLALTYTAHATNMANRPISHCKIIIRLPIHILYHKYSHVRIRSCLVVIFSTIRDSFDQFDRILMGCFTNTKTILWLSLTCSNG